MKKAVLALIIGLSIFACPVLYFSVGLVNWSMIGALLLIVLFLGSSSLAEEISRGKYPVYADYLRDVSKFFPGRRFDAETESLRSSD